MKVARTLAALFAYGIGALLACASVAGAEGVRLGEFEYFPEYTNAAPPPPEAVGPARTNGIVRATDSKPRDARFLRGRFDLDAQPHEVYALYISAANRGVRAFVNGVEVGSTSLSDAERFGWNYPLFFSIPPALLHPGSNTLDLRLTLNESGWGSLRDAEIGPHATLKPIYDKVLFWRITGPQITSLIAVLTGALALLVWMRRRRETVFLWFALTCFMAAIRNAHFYVSAPISGFWYEVWAAVPLHWMSAAFALFSLRLCERRFPKTEATLLWAALAWTLIVLLAGPAHIRLTVDLGYLWLMIVNLGILVFAFMQCLRQPKVERILLFIAVLVSVAFGTMDLTLLTSMRDSDWRVYMLPYSTLFISLAVGAVLVDAFARARSRQEQLNVELDARLAARERQLREQHRTLLKLEREQAVAHERQRILRDIHDGLGSQLISSIHLVEGGTLEPARVGALLRECVDDLRLAIDSLKPAGEDLLAVLGNFRYRMEPRLAHAGVRLDWHVAADSRSPRLGAQQILHTLRIVQEAVTNALKHASPSVLRISFREETEAGEWTLSVEDDGVGFRMPSDQSRGEGLQNMRTRAAQARLNLTIESNETGATVRIVGTSDNE